jgi:cyanophycinase
MISKGRLIIIRGIDKITTEESDCALTSYHLLTKAFGLISVQKDVRIEIIMTANKGAGKKERSSAILEKLQYHNTGCIHIQKKQDVDDYYRRILEAKVVVFDNNTPEICAFLRNSAMLELLRKRYHEEENFTIVGINAGAMNLSGLILNDTGGTDAGLCFINNCIIDTSFMHGARFKSLVKTVIGRQEYLGLGINEGTALLVEKGYIASCFGDNSIMVVNAKNVKNNPITRGDSVYKRNLKGHILTDGSVISLLNGELIKHHNNTYSLNFTNRNTIR